MSLSAPVALTCAQHPRRQASKRCLGCGDPICALCVAPTTVGDLCKPCARAAAHVRATKRSESSLPLRAVAGAGTLVSVVAWAFVFGVFSGGPVAGGGLMSYVAYSGLVGGAVGALVHVASGGRRYGFYEMAALFGVVAGYLIFVFLWVATQMIQQGANAVIIWVPMFLVQTLVNCLLAGLCAIGAVKLLGR